MIRKVGPPIPTILVLVGLALALTGCAATFNPHPQSIPVTSTPEGAQVFIDGNLVGTTPLTLELDGRVDYELIVRLDGQEHVIPLVAGVSGTYAALDVLPGLVVAGGSLAIARSAAAEIDGPASLGLVVFIFPILGGIGSSVVNVAVDGFSGQWLRLSPGHIHAQFY